MGQTRTGLYEMATGWKDRIGSLQLEAWGPELVSAAAFVSLGLAGFELSIDSGDKASLLSATLSVAAIFAGFIAGLMMLLITLPNEGMIKQLREAGYIPMLRGYLSRGVWGSIAVCMVSVAGFFTSVYAWPAYPCLWASISIYSLLSFGRCASLLGGILH